MYEDFFAARLAMLRTQKNVSAREMSLALGQNGSYINRIENQQAFPSMQAFFYICEYLQISPKDFFDTKIQDPTKIHALIEGLSSLNDRQLDLLLSLIREFNHTP